MLGKKSDNDKLCSNVLPRRRRRRRRIIFGCLRRRPGTSALAPPVGAPGPDPAAIAPIRRVLQVENQRSENENRPEEKK
jgi:hypothetical protein